MNAVLLVLPRFPRPNPVPSTAMALSVLFSRFCRASPLCAVLLLISADPAHADTARLSGTIFTIDANHTQTVWPNARISLKSLSTGKELTTVSNELGQYLFGGILPGDYQLSVALAGFATVRRRVTLTAGNPTIADFRLLPQSQSESVIVNANSTDAVDTSSSSGGGQVLTTPMLKSLVRLNEDFQEALPLLPGVLRGPEGLIRIKGGNANQANAFINNASIGDPFTGQPALRLPTPPSIPCVFFPTLSSPEFGDFSSGVIEVTTRGGGDEWKWLFEDPIPRFRWIDWQYSRRRELHSTSCLLRSAHQRQTLYLPIPLLWLRHSSASLHFPIPITFASISA